MLGAVLADREMSEGSTALTLNDAARRPDPKQGARPLSGFLAQLLACAQGLPPYRARRRAEPGMAAACYGEEAENSPPGKLDRRL